MLAYAFVALQYILPKHWLTAVTFKLARIRNPRIKNFLIEQFVKLYKVNTDEIRDQLPGDFETFNAFFVRELKDGARPIDDDAASIVSPVDGTVSAAGKLRDNVVLQAKGLDYTLEDLLATDLDEARAYNNGRFATIYLAPYNYHRVHAPFDARLLAARYVPGDLFSVNEATVSKVSGLFRRNERLVMHFTTAHGPAILVFVGALNVGSISTPWTGEVRPRRSGVVDVLGLSSHDTQVARGDLLGWFNMGSTVILVLPDGSVEWGDNLDPGNTLRMGEAIGTLSQQ